VHENPYFVTGIKESPILASTPICSLDDSAVLPQVNNYFLMVAIASGHCDIHGDYQYIHGHPRLHCLQGKSQGSIISGPSGLAESPAPPPWLP